MMLTLRVLPTSCVKILVCIIYFVLLFLSSSVLAGRETDSITTWNDRAKTLYTTQPEAAISLGRKAASAARLLGDRPGYAVSLARQGQAWQVLGVYDSAWACMSGYVAIKRELDDLPGVAMGNLILGDIALLRDEGQYARQLYHQALDTYRGIGDTVGMARTYDKLGSLFRMQQNEDTDSCRACHEWAIELQEARGYSSAASWTRLGNCLLVLEEQEAAHDALRHSLLLFRQANDRSNIAKTSSSLAVLMLHWPDSTDRSFAYSDTALAIHEANQYVRGQAIVRRTLGMAYDTSGQYELARYEYKRALDLARTINDRMLESELARRISRVAEHEESVALARARRTWIVSITLGTLLGVVALLSALVFRYQRKKRKLDMALAEARAREERQGLLDQIKTREVQALEANFQGQHLERQRIARNLHDQLGGLLSSLKLYYGSVEKRIEAPGDKLGKDLRRLEELIDLACDEVRRVSHDLKQDQLGPRGLEAALDGMARTLREAGGYTVELNVRLQGRELPGAMTRHLINVVQELVTNTIKYARAERIGIQVLARDGMLNLTYEDDGRGFDAARPTEGIGLRNMRERVEELGGELHLDAMTGRGTSVVIDLPLIP